MIRARVALYATVLGAVIGLFGGYATRAVRTGRTSDPEIARLGALARAALEAPQTRLADARTLVSRYVELVRSVDAPTWPDA